MKDKDLFLAVENRDKNNPFFHHVLNEIQDYAIFTMDKDGYITSWNKGAARIKEYQADEIVGQFYGILFPEESRPEEPRRELEEARQKGRFEDENWRRKKSGGLFWAGIVLTAIHDESGEVVGFIKITRDFTERKKIEDALYRQNQRLLKANADLDNFVYTASHDLKSPVTNIEGLIDTLQGETNPAKIEQILRYLKISVTKLKSTINDLANIAKMQKDIDEKSKQLIRIEETLEDVQYSLSNQMREDCPVIQKSLRVKKIRFSRLNLKSILYNLVSNSIKYRSPGRDCFIKVSTYEENGKLIIEVADNGLGMPKGYQQKIFKMFSRMHTHVDGSGIGLYILKRIVDNAQGTIDIQSKIGEGTTFKISLPNVLPTQKSKKAAG